MAKLSPKEIDKIFQDGSERYGFEYNEAAWGHMEDLLEKDDRRRFLWWWLGGVGVILLFGFIYFLIPTKESISKKEQVENDLLIKDVSKLQVNKHKEFQKENEVSLIEKSKTTNDLTEVNLELQKAILKRKNNNAFTNEKREKLFKKGDDSFISKVNSQIEYNNKNSLDNNDNSFVFRDTSVSKVVPLAMLDILAKQHSYSNTSKVHNLNFTKTFKIEKEENTPPKDSSKNNSLVIGLVAATEVSTIGRDNVCRPDFKYGVQVEYRFSKRFGTSIGINYIEKDYGAGEGEYTPPMGFWTDGVVPETTRGLCDIIEIPMNFSYFFNDFGESKNNFYATAGVTSYIMLRSEYNYFYGEDPPSPDLIKEWQVENGRDNLFGVGHISIGYERFLNNNTSIQLAPYVQIPLEEIGHGKVKIWSFGFTGKFNFHIK